MESRTTRQQVPCLGVYVGFVDDKYLWGETTDYLDPAKYLL